MWLNRPSISIESFEAFYFCKLFVLELYKGITQSVYSPSWDAVNN